MKLNEITAKILTDKQKGEKALMIEKALYTHNIWNASIRSDLLVDVDGDVIFKNKSFTKLPIQFGHVKGNFHIIGCKKLTNLQGCPTKVDKGFELVKSILLQSLNGMTQEVDGNVRIEDCYNLTSLEGITQKIGEDFTMFNLSGLTTLKGCPKEVGKSFFCFLCGNLKSFEYLPKQIHGKFGFRYLDAVRDYLRIFDVKGITEIMSSSSFRDKKLEQILSKYYLAGRDMLGCQDELIEAGLEIYAEVE